MSGDLLVFKLGFKFDDEEWVVPITDFGGASDLVTFINPEACKKSLNNNSNTIDSIVDNLMKNHIDELKKELRHLLLRKIKDEG